MNPQAGREPQQERSRRTARSIVEATQRLLETRSFQELTLEDVVEEAGCTVGAFYHYYPGKRALLTQLEQLFYSDAHEVFDAIGRDADTLTGQEILARGARQIAALYRRWRGALRALELETGSDAELRERMDQQSRGVAERIADLALPRMEIAHPRPREAMIFAVGAVRALMREVVLFADGSVLGMPLSPDGLAEEATRLAVGYLSLEERT